MKIYRKIVISLSDNKVLEESSYQYSGPIAEAKGENQIFRQQQSQSFNEIGRLSQSENRFYNDLGSLFASRYGAQSDTFNILQGNLARVIQGGGDLNYAFPRNADQIGPIYDVNGNIRGQEQITPAQQQALNQAAREARSRGDERTARQIESDPFGSLQRISGYDPSLYQPHFQPRRFMAREEAAMRADASEQTAQSYLEAGQAFGAQQQQWGPYGGGTEAAALRDLANLGASEGAAAQRDVTRFGSEQLRQDYRSFAPLGVQLQLAQADALSNEADKQNAWNLQMAQLRQQASMQRAALKAQAAGARAIAGAASAAARQRAFEFAQEQQLKGQQLASQNFFNAIQGLGSLGQMQNPLAYGELMQSTFGPPFSAYTNMYGTGSQGLVNTRGGGFWGALGGVLGGLGGSFVGGPGMGALMTNWLK